jgi:hypothetical protein
VRSACLLLLGCVCACACAWAGAAPAFKLTVGDYRYGDGETFSGQDINLRYRWDDESMWLGYYRDRVFGDQTRAGFDAAWKPVRDLDFVLQPSVQVASRGFLGGSVNAQMGETWYAMAGLGRTNLRPYQNLNFDPNDAFTLGVGYQAAVYGYSLYTIKDDRLHTAQRVTHAVAQFKPSNDSKLSLDVFRKTGRGDQGPVNAWGQTLSVDIAAWFFRIAHDPNQNFGAENALRFSMGIRF